MSDDRVSPARRVAYRVLRRVFEEGAYADRALRSEAEGLDPRERAFATQLAYGSVQRMGTLDAVIDRHAHGDLQPSVRNGLRLGAFQLLFLDGVPDHAAVDASVELAKMDAPRAAKLVNAVLRQIARDGRPVLDTLDDADRFSVPDWIVSSLFEQFGPAEGRALLATVNEPAEHALRANTLVMDADAVIARLDVPARRGSEPDEAVVVEGAFDAHGSQLFRDGAYMPQSRASMLVARALDPQPGERVLDLCAAPGGKATHLAALMRDQGTIVAVERNRARADGLIRTVRRMRVSSVEVVVEDARVFTCEEPFDRVLVDPPCSGLGTLSSRPDLRWRAQVTEQLVAEQREILRAGIAACRPGGQVVYSTCTLSPRENEDVVAGAEGVTVGDTRTTLPHRDGTDGFFIAELARNV